MSSLKLRACRFMTASAGFSIFIKCTAESPFPRFLLLSQLRHRLSDLTAAHFSLFKGCSWPAGTLAPCPPHLRTRIMAQALPPHPSIISVRSSQPTAQLFSSMVTSRIGYCNSIFPTNFSTSSNRSTTQLPGLWQKCGFGVWKCWISKGGWICTQSIQIWLLHKRQRGFLIIVLALCSHAQKSAGNLNSAVEKERQERFASLIKKVRI